MRIGIGIDAHKFEKNIKLVLGGVHIEYIMGLKGHSDADVLVHAIMDALLGSYALGDIGKHFPDDDEKYKNADSMELMTKLHKKHKFKIMNIDSVIICQKPKLAQYTDKMRENIAKTLDIDIDNVSVKATTTEYMGFTGRNEGIAAVAVALCE